MYRLLIADDEALEREGLELIIGRMLPDTFEIIHAENGRAAIELAEERRPHIVFMDVNMPGIDGLAALRDIRARLPETKLVLVTAYDYFAYAKEALTLGVKEYIVKPAGREQIVALLRQLLAELEQDRQRRAGELRLRQQVAELLPLAENELALMLMVDHVQGIGAARLAEWIDFPLDASRAYVVALPEKTDAPLTRKLYDTIRGFAKSGGQPCLVSSAIDRHMAIFVREQNGASTGGYAAAKRFAEQIAELARRQTGSPVTVGIGSRQEGESGLRQSYFEAVFASTCCAEGTGICLFDELREGKADLQSSVFAGVGSAGGEAGGAYVLSALQHIREEREHQTLTVLDKAKRYIGEHFTEELSLEEVADFVHLNPHYFSKVFKQGVGETFIDYVTGLRIERAKTLIADERLSLKEVCFEAGYRDPNYFSRVFKKVTGATPTEYRSGLRGAE
ncbi:response regulator [Paenibacillus methanolicus]|uniref:Two-component system response regulator YesN n=1 Tax=Paenibacillus methanolicus TaxID=582686 RepID=A0A5S5BSS5_9BACL|nr:response regulator [Paenibacillus methanolicus]TYP70215.1 two-component system response regulator YesN [Paenibacillus methanolicus]